MWNDPIIMDLRAVREKLAIEWEQDPVEFRRRQEQIMRAWSVDRGKALLDKARDALAEPPRSTGE